MEVDVTNTGKSKTRENYNMYKSVVLENKITNDKNDSENGNVIEKVVSESDTLKIDSEIVSERERVIGCNGCLLYTSSILFMRQFQVLSLIIFQPNIV